MIGYRTSFEIDLDPHLGLREDNAISQLLVPAFRWMEGKSDGVADLEPGRQVELPNGDKAIYLQGTTEGGTDYGRFVYFDWQEDRQEQWVLSYLIGVDRHRSDARPQVLIEVDGPPARRAGRPRIVRSLVDTFQCSERGLSLKAQPQDLSTDSLDRLFEFLQDERRRSLVVLAPGSSVIPHSQWRDIVNKLTNRTMGQASVFVLDEETTEAFNERVPAGFRLTALHPRTFRPPVDFAVPADGLRHRMLSWKRLRAASDDNEVLRHLQSMYERSCRQYVNLRPLPRELVRLEAVTSRLLDECVGLRQMVQGQVEDRPAQMGQDESIRGTSSLAGGSVIPRTETRASDTSAASVIVEQVDAGSGDLEPLHGTLEELRAEVRQLRAETAHLKIEHDQARARVSELEALQTQTIHHVANFEKVRDQWLDKRKDLEDEINGLHEQLVSDLDERGDLLNRLRVVTEQRDAALADLRLHPDIDSGAAYIETDDPYVQELFEWEEIAVFGGEKFPHLVFTCDWDIAETLDEHAGHDLWVRNVWDILATLDSYCAFRLSDSGAHFAGGLKKYLDEEQKGAHTISPGMYAPTESDAVKTNDAWARERYFDVPREIIPSGGAYMWGHFRVQTRSSVSPRLYFLDCIDKAGKIVVGYIGPHLTNTRTN